MKRYKKFNNQWYKRDKGFYTKEEAYKRSRYLWERKFAVKVVFWDEVRSKKGKYDWYVYTKVYNNRDRHTIKWLDNITITKNKEKESKKKNNLIYIETNK